MAAVYHDARNPFAHTELLDEGYEPWSVLEVWMMASPVRNRWVDVTDAFPRKLDALLKATGVDGVYTGDPKKDKTARFIPDLSFQEALVNGYAVMDANAFGLCKENGLPIVVFNINQPGAIGRVLAGDRVGTLVR